VLPFRIRRAVHHSPFKADGAQLAGCQPENLSREHNLIKRRSRRRPFQRLLIAIMVLRLEQSDGASGPSARDFAGKRQALQAQVATLLAVLGAPDATGTNSADDLYRG
jgi:hypothetical protein